MSPNPNGMTVQGNERGYPSYPPLKLAKITSIQNQTPTGAATKNFSNQNYNNFSNHCLNPYTNKLTERNDGDSGWNNMVTLRDGDNRFTIHRFNSNSRAGIIQRKGYREMSTEIANNRPNFNHVVGPIPQQHLQFDASNSQSNSDTNIIGDLKIVERNRFISNLNHNQKVNSNYNPGHLIDIRQTMAEPRYSPENNCTECYKDADLELLQSRPISIDTNYMRILQNFSVNNIPIDINHTFNQSEQSRIQQQQQYQVLDNTNHNTQQYNTNNSIYAFTSYNSNNALRPHSSVLVEQFPINSQNTLYPQPVQLQQPMMAVDSPNIICDGRVRFDSVPLYNNNLPNNHISADNVQAIVTGNTTNVAPPYQHESIWHIPRRLDNRQNNNNECDASSLASGNQLINRLPNEVINTNMLEYFFMPPNNTSYSEQLNLKNNKGNNGYSPISQPQFFSQISTNAGVNDVQLYQLHPSNIADTLNLQNPTYTQLNINQPNEAFQQHRLRNLSQPPMVDYNRINNQMSQSALLNEEGNRYQRDCKQKRQFDHVSADMCANNQNHGPSEVMNWMSEQWDNSFPNLNCLNANETNQRCIPNQITNLIHNYNADRINNNSLINHSNVPNNNYFQIPCNQLNQQIQPQTEQNYANQHHNIYHSNTTSTDIGNNSFNQETNVNNYFNIQQYDIAENPNSGPNNFTENPNFTYPIEAINSASRIYQPTHPTGLTNNTSTSYIQLENANGVQTEYIPTEEARNFNTVNHNTDICYNNNYCDLMGRSLQIDLQHLPMNNNLNKEPTNFLYNNQMNEAVQNNGIINSNNFTSNTVTLPYVESNNTTQIYNLVSELSERSIENNKEENVNRYCNNGFLNNMAQILPHECFDENFTVSDWFKFVCGDISSTISPSNEKYLFDLKYRQMLTEKALGTNFYDEKNRKGNQCSEMDTQQIRLALIAVAHNWVECSKKVDNLITNPSQKDEDDIKREILDKETRRKIQVFNNISNTYTIVVNNTNGVIYLNRKQVKIESCDGCDKKNTSNKVEEPVVNCIELNEPHPAYSFDNVQGVITREEIIGGKSKNEFPGTVITKIELPSTLDTTKPVVCSEGPITSFGATTNDISVEAARGKAEIRTISVDLPPVQIGRIVHIDNVRHYRCLVDNCEATYTKTSHLKGHIKMHTGDKPFVCHFPVCKWSFARSDELTRHVRKHTGDKPYVCSFCTKEFSRCDHQTLHLKKHLDDCNWMNSFFILMKYFSTLMHRYTLLSHEACSILDKRVMISITFFIYLMEQNPCFTMLNYNQVEAIAHLLMYETLADDNMFSLNINGNSGDKQTKYKLSNAEMEVKNVCKNSLPRKKSTKSSKRVKKRTKRGNNEVEKQNSPSTTLVNSNNGSVNSQLDVQESNNNIINSNNIIETQFYSISQNDINTRKMPKLQVINE